MTKRIFLAFLIALLVRLAPAWACGSLPGKPLPPIVYTEQNVQGMWWADPPGSEPGWGIQVVHQGSTLFATYFTYDDGGAAIWYHAPQMEWDEHAGTYTGRMYRSTGPAFSAANWTPAAHLTYVGNARLSFWNGAARGDFSYAPFAGPGVAKSITRYKFAPRLPTCDWSDEPGDSGNYSALWWNMPPGSEPGWGVNLTHQGDAIFATWFTYRADGSPDWILMANGKRTGESTYSGELFRTHGPSPFSPAQKWDASKVVVTPAGNATFTFDASDTGTFAYTLDGVTQSKPITRFTFSSPRTVCTGGQS